MKKTLAALAAAMTLAAQAADTFEKFLEEKTAKPAVAPAAKQDGAPGAQRDPKRANSALPPAAGKHKEEATSSSSSGTFYPSETNATSIQLIARFPSPVELSPRRSPLKFWGASPDPPKRLPKSKRASKRTPKDDPQQEEASRKGPEPCSLAAS